VLRPPRVNVIVYAIASGVGVPYVRPPHDSDAARPIAARSADSSCDDSAAVHRRGPAPPGSGVTVPFDSIVTLPRPRPEKPPDVSTRSVHALDFERRVVRADVNLAR